MAYSFAKFCHFIPIQNDWKKNSFVKMYEQVSSQMCHMWKVSNKFIISLMFSSYSKDLIFVYSNSHEPFYSSLMNHSQADQ